MELQKAKQLERRQLLSMGHDEQPLPAERNGHGETRRAPAPPSIWIIRSTRQRQDKQDQLLVLVEHSSRQINSIELNMSTTGEPATVVQMDDGKSSSYATAPAYTAGTSATAPPRKAAGGGGGLPLLLRSGADGFRRCLAVIDFVLRVAALGPTLAAAISTGTSDERLSVFTQFFQFHARFDDFPAFTFFMVANAIAAGYLVLSLPFSAVGILRPKAAGVRLFLLVCDVVVMLLLTAGGAAAAAIVYVAHWGNLRANWVPICMQFHGFCQRTSGAVVASFLAVVVFFVLILMAACAIRRRW